MGRQRNRTEGRPEPASVRRLRGAARRLTGPRRAILGVLTASEHPLSVREIFRRMRGCDCDLATVYRSMHLLKELGLVKQYELGDGLARFELLREGDDGHHHHLVCTRCAGVVEIEGCEVRGLDEAIGSRNGFKGVTHRLEFFGVCPSCQRA